MINKQNSLLSTVSISQTTIPHTVQCPEFDRERFEDVGFLTAMIMVLMGNYSQTGHYGGPLAYTPYNVSLHLAHPSIGGLAYDLRNPKHPFADKFMLTGGHCIPTCYSLWMILYEAMLRRYQLTGDKKYYADPHHAILSIDALGFRRSSQSLVTLLPDHNLADHPLFQQAKLRGIRSLAGHSETTDVTNDVNGGPSGIGVSTAAGKALFWNFVGAPPQMKVIALEGEFAMTEGHAQEVKTAAIAQQVGKRLRVMLSHNNAGIDDSLFGGVIHPRVKGYDIAAQWASYGWNVLYIENGNDYSSILSALNAMELIPSDDPRPVIVVGQTTKGFWPAAQNNILPSGSKVQTGFASHPYNIAMNSPSFIALAESFEQKYQVQFQGIRDGKPGDEQQRMIQCKTNIDIALSVLEKKHGLCEWIADTVLENAQTLTTDFHLIVDSKKDPFMDNRFCVENLPQTAMEVSCKDPRTGKESKKTIQLFLPKGEKKGARRAISEVCKWMNYVSGNRFLTVAADLSESINVEHGHFFGHYDPFDNPSGTRLKAGIQEAVNTSTILGLISQTLSKDPNTHSGVWGLSGTYGAFTPLMYTPARIFSQQNQDSPFSMGVLTILAGHSGPETAADGRTHFGIFAPQVWTLFPRGQVINLYLWDYNDVAPAYCAAVSSAARKKEIGIIVIHVARPDTVVVDRNTFADSDILAASKGLYMIADYLPHKPRAGTVLVQGSSSTQNTVALVDRLRKENINVRIISVISPELFELQSSEYKQSIMPFHALFDCMVVSTFTKRVPPLPNLGPLTEEYSLYADFDDRWRTCGSESDIIAESHLDMESIYQGIVRFAQSKQERISRQREHLI